MKLLLTGAVLAACSLALAQDFDVRKYGATGDGKTKDTAAIQRALDACTKQGGRVVVPAGTYLMGSIYLKDNTELHLMEDARLLGSPDLNDYNADNAYPQNWGSKTEGWSAKHLIIAVGRRNVAITGKGIVDGNGRAFFDTKIRWKGDICWRDGAINARDAQHAKRPGQEIVFVECTGVTVRGVTLTDMSAWSCFFHGCENVTVGHVTVMNDMRHLNTDGFDIDSCRNVRLGDCTIVTGDDAIAVRGSPKYLTDAQKVCEDIRVSNVVCRVSADGVRVGVGDGTIRDVHISDMKILHAGRGLHVQSCYGRPRKGVDISNVTFSRIYIRDAAEPILVGAGSDACQSQIKNIRFELVDVEAYAPVVIVGGGTARPTNVDFNWCVFRLIGAPGEIPDDGEAGPLTVARKAAFRIEKAGDVSFTHSDLIWGKDVAADFEKAFAVGDAPAPKLKACAIADRAAAAAEKMRDVKFTKPDYVVYVPQQLKSRAFFDPARRGDSYNDHFQVIWDAKRRLYYAFWTQASWEGAGDHHIAFSRSFDGGRTWTPMRVLAGSETRDCKGFGADWQQPMLTKSGRLYCLWNQQVRAGYKWPSTVLAGRYSDDGGETWSEPDLAARPGSESKVWALPLATGWINWQRPLRLGREGRYFVGCSADAHIKFWEFENMDSDPEIKQIAISQYPDRKLGLGVEDMTEPQDYVSDDTRKVLEEASVVKLPDGRLFALMRSTTGHPVWSQSRDGGKSWETPKFLRDKTGRVYLQPRSPCPIYDWKGPEAGSGFYFALIHDVFDLNDKRTPYQKRTPLYLIAGRFDPKGEQPIVFAEKKFFAGREAYWNSFYTSYTVADGQGILWYPDVKYYLLGRKIGPEWFGL